MPPPEQQRQEQQRQDERDGRLGKRITVENIVAVIVLLISVGAGYSALKSDIAVLRAEMQQTKSDVIDLRANNREGATKLEEINRNVATLLERTDPNRHK